MQDITGKPAREPLDIVALMPSSWGVVRSLPDYTVLELAAAGHRVLAVEPLQSFATAIRVARWQNRSLAKQLGRNQIAERIWVYSPPPVGMVGISRSPVAARLNGRLLAALLRPQLGALGFRQPVVWSFQYGLGEAMRRLPARLRVYECGDHDEALARSEWQRAAVRALEADSCKTADLVICCTEELCSMRRQYNCETYEVNCAADTAFFGDAMRPGLVVPLDIAGLPKPVLGYMGGLDPWKIDVELLRSIARARPDWSIALVGYVWFGFDPGVFADTPNIHVLGAKDYADFPAYLKGMDVCLMPFPLNDITRNGDALKCYEYLAAGKPVVSRSVPVARRLGQLVRIADDATSFVREIEAALQEGEDARHKRVAAITAHSWRDRVRNKLDLIEARLPSAISSSEAFTA